ncbi:MAG: hypothetical protein K2X03_22490 [Bryobacteraceae bacterium]|nr:hypothetical protein [Bryobacteraceae bacterium]
MSRDERAAWFLNRWARPSDSQEATLQRITRRSAVTAVYNWTSLGPNNVGGRATALAVSAQHPDTVFLGTAGGGVWRTEDAGLTWQPWSDELASLSVGALALHSDGSLYLATGEANLNLDSYPGCGIFRSSGGPTWASVVDEVDGPQTLPNRIGALALDPLVPGRIFAGSATIVDEDLSGLHIGRAGDNGIVIWDLVDGFAFEGAADPSDVAGPYRCHSIVCHPARTDVVYAAVHLRGWRSGIYRSLDGGQTWTHLETGLPSGEKFGRTSLAIGHRPADGAQPAVTVLWAYAGHTREGVLGVFRSDDDGDTWQSNGGTHFANETSANYDNCIAVAPDNPEFVICGGRDLHRTRDGGRTWQQITEFDAPEADPHFAPGGHHALVLAANGRVYDANEGGCGVSDDHGDTWTQRHAGLATSMFFKVDVAGAEGGIVAGSVHHEGVVLHRQEDPPQHFDHQRHDEGGWMLMDPEDPEHLVSTSPGGEVYRHTREEGWKRITPAGLEAKDKEDLWMPIVAMDGSPGRKNPRPLLLGTTRLWKSNDDGETWRAVSPVLDSSPVSAIHFSAQDRVVYAGTERGGFFRSDDGGNTWGENLAGIDLPYRYITRIAAHPESSAHVLVAVGPSPDPGQAHVYLSLDAGHTWRATGEGLPDAPHNCVVFHEDTPYVATDFGVYRGAWTGESYTWTDISGDLPQAFVMDLVVHAESRTLTAATYGRGLFRHRIGSQSDPSAEWQAWAQADLAAAEATPPAPPPAP